METWSINILVCIVHTTIGLLMELGSDPTMHLVTCGETETVTNVCSQGSENLSNVSPAMTCEKLNVDAQVCCSITVTWQNQLHMNKQEMTTAFRHFMPRCGNQNRPKLPNRRTIIRCVSTAPNKCRYLECDLYRDSDSTFFRVCEHDK